ncbi:MAG TPA: hypothetical protein V6D14_35715 [Coleofasciculaceae cyanobacterium]|jgi:hypothetical protein
MVNLHTFKSGTAALLALTITSSTIVPLVTAVPASAQWRRSPESGQNENDRLGQNGRYRLDNLNLVLPSGTSIPVRYDKEKIVLTPDETVPVTFTVATDVRNSNGNVVIPEGSQLIGDLRPTSGGSRFVAKEVTLLRRRMEQQSKPFSINASSDVVTRTEEVKKGANTGSILTGAAIGAGAAAAISAITGDHSVNAWEVIGGAGAGALGGWLLNRKSANMVVVYPERDLNVRLTSEFALR